VVDTFEAHLPQGADARAVARFVGPEKVDARLVVMVQDRRIATLDVPAARAIEVRSTSCRAGCPTTLCACRRFQDTSVPYTMVVKREIRPPHASVRPGQAVGDSPFGHAHALVATRSMRVRRRLCLLAYRSDRTCSRDLGAVGRWLWPYPPAEADAVLDRAMQLGVVCST